MLAAKSASPLICGLSKPVSRSSRSCSITAAMWAMPPVVERMKPSDPVEVEGIHNVSVTLLQILSGGEGVDCSSLVGPLMESELFGYAKGAFTGAHNQKLASLSQ